MQDKLLHIVVTPHSFVDLITNSSSELFVCDTDKSIDAVAGVIMEVGSTILKK